MGDKGLRVALGAPGFPFAERVGEGFGQLQALRTKCFDREVRRFPAAVPGGAVVALGEGLETQFWRVDNGAVRWVGVDLPEVEELRGRLLPTAERITSGAESALDLGWLEARRLAASSPRIPGLRALPLPPGRGRAAGFLLPLQGRREGIRRRLLSVNRLTSRPRP